MIQNHSSGKMVRICPFLLVIMVAPCSAQEHSASRSWPATEFLYSLGAVVFLVLLFGLLIWNRYQQIRAQQRTQDLLDRLNESNAQTRDLQSEIVERRHTEATLLRLSNLKRLIARLSSEFVRMSPHDLDSDLQRGLNTIAEFIGVSRAYIFLVRPDGQTIDNTYEWCSKDSESLKDRHQALSLTRQLPWFASRIRDFHLIRITSGEALTDDIFRERLLLGQDSRTSTLIFPMASGNTLRGFMGFDSRASENELGEDIVDLLKVVGEIFTHALDRERSEKTLRESEERFRELSDLLPLAIFEMDLKYCITYINRQGLLATGYSEGVPLSTINGFNLFADEDRARLKQRFATMLATGEEISAQEYSCVNKEHSVFPAMIYARLILRDGKPVGFRCILVDMTRHKQEEEERRRLETQFLQTQKFESLSVMAGSIAHNFNNLLTVVLGNLELVLTDTPSDAPWMDHLVEADRAVKRAAELSSMMLTYVGKSRFNLTQYDLSVLVRDLYGMLHASLSRKITLEVNTEPDACMVKGDPVRIRQVVVNLFNNAAEAIGDQTGKIVIRTGVLRYTQDQESMLTDKLEEGEYAFLEVIDDGPGMDPLTKERVFDPFFTTKFTGRGMGMAAVLGIVRAHQGGITLSSETGQGTRVTVMFPRGEAQATDPQVVSTNIKPPYRGSGMVLLVDDEAMILSVGQRMLQRLGFQVTTAPDGVEALKIFKANPGAFVCVVLDLSMPHMDGDEVFREMIALRPNTTVILASGYARDQILPRFEDHQPAGFIRKPYQIKDLSRVLEETLLA